MTHLFRMLPPRRRLVIKTNFLMWIHISIVSTMSLWLRFDQSRAHRMIASAVLLSSCLWVYRIMLRLRRAALRRTP